MRNRIDPRSVSMWFGAFLTICLGLAAGGSRAEEVKIFSSPPSMEELEKALSAGGGDKPKFKTRSIVIDDDPSRPPQAAQGAVVGFPINFDLGSASIKEDSLGYLDAIANLMRKNTALRFQVEGHTDITGNPGRNVELSKARAASVRNYLISRQGIAKSRLESVGKGSSEPINRNDPAAGENRRVQFRVLG